MKVFNRLFAIIASILLISSVEVTAQAKSVTRVTQIATVDADSLRLRSGPSTGYTTITTAPRDEYVLITGKSGEWYRVSYNLKTGYMHERYLQTYHAKNVELGYGVVSGNLVNLRSGPGTSYASVAKANAGEKAYVIGFNQQWYKVIYKELICYIRSDYLELTQIPYENKGSVNTPLFFLKGNSTGISPSAEALKGTSSIGRRDQVVAVAKQYLGSPYAWGGSTANGFDCSGFVQFVMKQCGISIPRTTELQAKIGSSIHKKDLRPGDLVFLQNTYRTGISHVGIYIGNNRMIHASSSKGVTISDLTTSYYVDHFHSARKIIE